jgi:hypothetical protein
MAIQMEPSDRSFAPSGEKKSEMDNLAVIYRKMSLEQLQLTLEGLKKHSVHHSEAIETIQDIDSQKRMLEEEIKFKKAIEHAKILFNSLVLEETEKEDFQKKIDNAQNLKNIEDIISSLESGVLLN